MADEHPVSPASEEKPPSADPSSLKGLTMALGIQAANPGHDPLLGRDIGGVTIVRLIAEGGMGRVYEGMQERPKRQVAVKVMRPGFISREASQRFGMELEILGKLRHPYIAQIYSAGMCDVVGCQVPFFVMEYIPDALSLTRYAKEKMLGTDARIALFQKVCEAVAHGHEQGVVHRDLKPSNILVEATGNPKIIDFGIARTVGDSPEQMTALTELGQLIGTLQYMSPEQIEADPTAIDQRTDVYALGVILYELLTGARPYEISSQQIFEAARIVREKKPVSPLKFNRTLRPDVVKITGTCLQKDRTHRFANASELGFALGNYLAGQKVVGVSRRAFATDRRTTLALVAAGALLAGGAAYGYLAGYIFPRVDEAQLVHDRSVAEWVLRTQGKVQIQQDDVQLSVTDAARLPPTPFRLTGIDMTGNANATDENLARLKDLKHLEVLSIGGTRVTDKVMEYVSGSETLKHLGVNWTRVTGNGIALLKKAKLTFIDASGARDIETAMPILRQMGTMDFLNINSCQMSEAIIPDLLAMSTLKGLNFNQKDFSEDAVKKLRSGMPQCRIHLY